MSHFTVGIVTKGMPSGEELHSMLEPYDENLEVIHYVTKDALIREKRKEIEDYKNSTYAEYLQDPVKYAADCQNEQHLKYVRDEFPKKLQWSDEECYQDAIKYDEQDSIQPDGSVRRTYNPNSKWDWYQIGGRWSGLLTIKEDGVLFSVDSARIKDIVFTDKEKQFNRAMRFWELYVEGQEPQNDEEREMIKFVWHSPSYYKKAYTDKQTYAECSSTFTTYAAITKDGKWHEQGQMGWWGMSSGDDEVGWAKGYKKLIFDNADDNDYLTIVDCHI